MIFQSFPLFKNHFQVPLSRESFCHLDQLRKEVTQAELFICCVRNSFTAGKEWNKMYTHPKMFGTLCLVDHIFAVTLSLALNLAPLESFPFPFLRMSLLWGSCVFGMTSTSENQVKSRENLPNYFPPIDKHFRLFRLQVLFVVWIVQGGEGAERRRRCSKSKNCATFCGNSWWFLYCLCTPVTENMFFSVIKANHSEADISL